MTLCLGEQLLDMFCQAVLEIVRMPKCISDLHIESVFYCFVANCHKFDKHSFKVNQICDIKKITKIIFMIFVRQKYATRYVWILAPE